VRTLDGAFDHHRLALAFMTQGREPRGSFAGRRGNGLRCDLDILIGRLADAGVEVNTSTPSASSVWPDELRLHGLGVERHDHQNLGFAAHALSPVE
jgi:hypothetical protein